MERLLARVSQNDLHWLTSMETQDLRALLDLVQTAKRKRLDLAVLLEARQSLEKVGIPLAGDM